MKVRLFLFVVFCSLNITYGIAQKCKVQGVVRYEFNDYVGYKAVSIRRNAPFTL